MTFELRATTDVLTAYFGAADAVTDEIRLHVTPTGWESTAVDPANVGMIDESLATDAFESYETGGDGRVTLGLNVPRVLDILSMGDSDDGWAIVQDDRKVILRSGGLEYTMATIDPDSIRSEPDLPDLDLPATAVLEWRHVDRAITACDMVADQLRINRDEAGAFVIDAEGDTDDVNERIDRALEDGSEMPGGDPVMSIFSIEYLQDFSMAIDPETEVTLHFGEEFPVKIEWTDQDGAHDVTFMCAPRIQSD